MSIKAPLNILFMASWFPSRNRPTDGNFIQRHAEAVATKHKVSVLHVITSNDLAAGNLEWEVKTEKGVQINIGYIGQRKNPFLRWRDYFKAYKRGWQAIEKPDVIHLNVIFPAGLFAQYFSKKYSVPLIATEHWTGYHSQNKSKTNKLVWRLHRYIAKRTNVICPVSSDLKNSMIKCGLKSSYSVIPNVVDTAIFCPKNEETDLSSAKTLLHVSTLDDQHKNVSGILESFSALLGEGMNLKLVIVGDGNLKPHQKKAVDLSIPAERISFHGTQSPEGIAKFMQTADVFLLFSNYENLPCVILESFATGTPVISTDVGGIAEHFPKNGGILVEKGNKEQFKNAIRNLINRPPSQHADLVKYARENFSKEAVAQMFSEVYEKVLAKSKP